MRHLRLTAALVLLCTLTYSGYALPQYSLLTGTRCSACHYAPTGGGIRTELGWSAMNETGLFKWSSNQTGASSSNPGDAFGDTTGAQAQEPPAQEMPAGVSNSFFKGLVTVGYDVRAQIAQTGNPPNNVYKFIPMQISPYVGLNILPELSVYGSANVGGIVYKAMSKTNSTYNGMSDFNAAVQYQPSVTAPTIRVGMIQPAIGIRYDDHTAYTRRESAETGSPIIPPDYNEMGADVTYEGMHWLSLNAGVYSGYYLSLSENSIGTRKSLLDFSSPSINVRAMVWPQILAEGINTEAGVSYFANGDFKMINGFAGVGLADKATFQGEAMYSENAFNRITRNISIMGSYHLQEWLSLEWRYDFGQTEYPGTDLYHSQAFLMGAQFFPFPGIEIRPEYRFRHVDHFQNIGDSFLGEYVVQFHFFY